MSREGKNGQIKTVPEQKEEAAWNQDEIMASARAAADFKGGGAENRYKGISEMLTALRENIRSGIKGASFSTSLGDGVLGLAPGRIVVLSGDSGVGKSSLGLSCVFDMLYQYPQLRAVICSVDLSAEEILERELSRLSAVPLQAIQERGLGADQQQAVNAGSEKLWEIRERLCLLNPPLDCFHINEAVRDFRADVLMLDYIQELDYPEGCDRREAIDDVLRLCRRFKREGKTILITSEVTHSPSGLHPKESGQIRYEADDEYTMTVTKATNNGPRIATLAHTKARRVPRNLKLRFYGGVHRWELIPDRKVGAA